MVDDSGSGPAAEIELGGPDHVTTTTSTVEEEGHQSSSQIDQIITSMDLIVYNAAAEGDIYTFTDTSVLPSLDLILTPNKNTILHIHITARCEKKGPTDFVEDILQSCPLLLLQENTKGEIPLHVAARYGDCDIVKVLIEHAKAVHRDDDLEMGILAARDMIRMSNKEGDTALHEAVRYNHLDVLQLLIEEDPEFSYSANDTGETPLYLAADRGFSTLVPKIVGTCASLAHGGPMGRTALHTAVIHEYIGIAETILEWKGVLAKEVDEQGWSPLHHAANCGYLSMVKLLLHYDKSMAYVKDRDGWRTPLHIAANRRRTEIVKEIISCCPDCCELVDKRGWNVLHFAVESRSRHTLIFILKKSSLTYLIHERDEKGNTPLHLLATSLSPIDALIINPRVDKMALNKENLNALDIILAKKEYFWEKVFIRKRLKKAGVRAGRHIVAYKDYDTRKRRGELANEHYEQLKQDRGNHIVVAALIATVTFAAGFTLPGGYVQEKGENQGSAVLLRQKAFQAFVITDTLAMVLSSSSILIHIVLRMTANQRKYHKYFRLSTYLTLFAMGAMVLAFLTGMCAVLEQSLALAIATSVIASSFFLVFLFRLLK